MISYLIGCTLPLPLKHQLASFCHGLPFVEWVEEENFHLDLRYLGPLNEQVLLDVREALSQLDFSPFSIQLQGIHDHQSKRGSGVLTIDVQPQTSLLLLKKKIDQAMKNLAVAPQEKGFKASINLGKHDHSLASQKLAEYLSLHSMYRSEPLTVASFVLFQIHPTSKRILYEQLEEYPAQH